MSVLVWACDRIARSTRHFLEVLDELNSSRGRVRQLPGKYRHRRPVGPGHRGHHRRHRRTGTQPDRRTGARRHAARPARRPAHRAGLRWCWTTLLSSRTVNAARASGRSPKGIASRRPPSNASFGIRPDRTSSPCDKRAPKTHPLNSTKQTAGSHRSGRVKRCGFRNEKHQRKAGPSASLAVWTSGALPTCEDLSGDYCSG